METARRVVIPYAPRRQFMGYHETSKRWRIIVAHRRAGKTVACINNLVRSALTCPLQEPRTAYIAPLYRQAKDVAWTYLKRFTDVIPGAEPHESELRVDLPNGGRVRLYGADNPDGMRGIYLDDCVLDEFADMRPRVLPEIIRPALSDRKGSLTLIGTPKGHNEFYDIWKLAQNDNDWFSLVLRASETGLVDAEELLSARKMMTPEQYDQEYECSFEAAILGAYWGREMAQAEREGRITDVPWDPAQPVHTAWDLGRRDATAIWFFQVLFGGVNVIDYYENTQKGAPHYAAELKARPYTYGRNYIPHDGNVVEWGSDRSRVETLEGMGVKCWLVPAHSLQDGINAARLTIPQTRFDRAKCAAGLEALKQYRSDYDEEKKVFKDQPRHDWASHGADAWRYLSMGWRELKQELPPEPPKRDAWMGNADGTISSAMTFHDMIERQRKRREDA